MLISNRFRWIVVAVGVIWAGIELAFGHWFLAGTAAVLVALAATA